MIFFVMSKLDCVDAKMKAEIRLRGYLNGSLRAENEFCGVPLADEYGNRPAFLEVITEYIESGCSAKLVTSRYDGTKGISGKDYLFVDMDVIHTNTIGDIQDAIFFGPANLKLIVLIWNDKFSGIGRLLPRPSASISNLFGYTDLV